MKTSIFGSTGLLGRSLRLTAPSKSTIFLGSKDVDLTCQISHKDILGRAVGDHTDLWINAAARVGGLAANTNMMAEFCRDNMMIGNGVIDSAHRLGVSKLVSIMSTCIYPAVDVVYPLTENQMHNGPPHDSNFGYAYAKRMLDVMSQAYRRQWGCNFITVVPNNLYGLNDNYDVSNGHVIPSLIRKFYEATVNRTNVTVWGTGRPLREFTFAEDAARIIWWCAENYNGSDPINIGNTEEISIIDVAHEIGRILEFKGQIKFDDTKPDGQYRKPTSNKKLRDLGCDLHYSTLSEGLERSISFFVKNYPNLRGI